jgi:hypothetical protein
LSKRRVRAARRRRAVRFLRVQISRRICDEFCQATGGAEEVVNPAMARAVWRMICHCHSAYRIYQAALGWVRASRMVVVH